jgi:thiamine biosynthesis lipoprotein ApbE
VAQERGHVELSSNHRDTLSRIFEHPVSHNIEWQAVLSLLRQVGTVDQEHDGSYHVTLGDETETFHRPRDKDVSSQQVVDLRRMLRNAGYGPEDTGKKS